MTTVIPSKTNQPIAAAEIGRGLWSRDLECFQLVHNCAMYIGGGKCTSWVITFERVICRQVYHFSGGASPNGYMYTSPSLQWWCQSKWLYVRKSITSVVMTVQRVICTQVHHFSGDDSPKGYMYASPSLQWWWQFKGLYVCKLLLLLLLLLHWRLI